MRSRSSNRLLGKAAVSTYGPLLAIIAVVVGGIAAKNILGDITGPDGAALFYRELDADLLDDYGSVIAVAHNAGGHTQTAQLAIEHNADVIEIDVASNSTTLYAAHAPPKFVVPSALTASSLNQAWRAAAEHATVMLDLKQSSRSFLVRVASFLHSRPTSHVFVVSRSRSALAFLDREVPQATLLYSVAARSALDSALNDEEFVSVVDGISAASGILDEATIGALEERSLMSFAWVVNRIDRVNELVSHGVDGIITDNLALLELLGDDRNEEPGPDEPSES